MNIPYEVQIQVTDVLEESIQSLGELYYPHRELENQAKNIKTKLLKIKNVAKVEVFGIQNPAIEVLVQCLH